MENSCIVERPATFDEMIATLRSQQQFMTQLQSLAGEFAALDFQPIVIIDGQVQPRNITLPENLTQAMQLTAAKIHQLKTQIHALDHRS